MTIARDDKLNPPLVSPYPSLPKKASMGGDVELNESGSLWPPLGMDPPSIVLPTINLLSNWAGMVLMNRTDGPSIGSKRGSRESEQKPWKSK